MHNLMVRTRNNGRTYELRIKHRALPKPVYRSFSSESEAYQAGRSALDALSRGESPEWLNRPDRNPIPTIKSAVLAYLAAKAVPRSTESVLMTVISDVGQVRLADVSYHWTENWIESLKVERRIAPGTIRKKVGALRRALNWLIKCHPQSLSSNPLADLDHGYSSYNERVRQILAAAGADVPHDVERDRRISATEEKAIVEALQRFRDKAESDRDRAYWDGIQFMFLLALRTAMRLREIYTLTRDQLDPDGKTIYLRRTKSGSCRSVPVNTEARAILQRSWPILEKVSDGRHMLPFWKGTLNTKELDALTSELSRAFAKAVQAAGLEDLHFHDTRHEAVCRWVLNAPGTLTSEQLGRAAGMKDQRTRMRYLSLRGSELADCLG